MQKVHAWGRTMVSFLLQILVFVPHDQLYIPMKVPLGDYIRQRDPGSRDENKVTKM